MSPRSSYGYTPLDDIVDDDLPIPRSLTRIAPNQQKLLDNEDSWYSKLSQSKVGQCNIPAEDLTAFTYHHTSRIPPPPGQKPPTSSTSIPNGSGKTEVDGAQGQQENSGQGSGSSRAGSELSWSQSPERPPRLQQQSTGADIRSSPPVLPGRERSSQQTPPSSSKQNRGFYSQPPISPLLLPSDSSSIATTGKPGEQLPAEGPTNTSRRASTRLPAVEFPPSSAEVDDEIPMEIPGAILHATPTPPMQIAGAITHATPPMRRLQQKMKSLHPTVMDTPPCGQGHLIQSTYPDVRQSSDQPAPDLSSSLPGESLRQDASNPSSTNGRTSDMESKQSIKKFKILKFSPEEKSSHVVLIQNTPDPAPNTKKLVVEQSPAGNTSPIASTFPVADRPLTTQGLTKAATPEAPEVPAVESTTIEDDGAVAKTTPPPAPAPAPAPEAIASPPALQSENTEVTDAITEAVNVAITEAANVADVAVWAQSPSPVPQPQPPAAPSAAAAQGVQDMSAFFWNHPFQAFCLAYPTFHGSIGDFVRACLSLRSLHRKSRLPVFLYDDFIRIFCDDYIEYIEGTSDDEPKVAMEWYVENVMAPVFNRGIVTTKNLGRVFKIHADEFESANNDMYLSSPTAERAISRRSSDGSHSRADVQLRPLTKTPPQYRDLSPMRNGHKRKASVMLSTEVSFEADDDVASHTGSLKASDAKTRQAEGTEEAVEPPRKKHTPPARERSINILEKYARPPSRSSPNISNGHREPTTARPSKEVDQDVIMMPPPRQRIRPPVRSTSGRSPISRTTSRSFGTAETTANDRIKARSRALPPSWAPQESVGEASSSQVQPTSPASTVLTQASGVKKRRRRMPSNEEYAARIAQMKAEGRFNNGMSSSAPQPAKKR